MLGEVEVLDGEIDDRGVLLQEELVAREAADMEEEVFGESNDAKPAPTVLDIVRDALPVVLLQDLLNHHLHGESIRLVPNRS